ncbi:MAG: hypothetical protein GF320_09105, partial [Armatimonadia bacterium]|nr:hypothetical protein [Armatimonadia bacterium]
AEPGQPPPPGTMPPPVTGPGTYGGGPVGEDPGGWTPENIKMIVASPAEFFAMQAGHTDLGKPIGFLAINMVLLVAASTLGQMLSMPLGGGLGGIGGLSMGGMMLGLICGSIIIVPLAIAATFLNAGILHLFVMMFGGTGGYNATFRVAVYVTVPSVLVALPAGLLEGFGPPLTHIASALQLGCYVWATVLTVIAFMHVHEMTMGRAIGAAVLPYLILIGFIVLVVVMVFGAAFSSGAFGSGGIPGLPFPTGGPGPSPGGP